MFCFSWKAKDLPTDMEKLTQAEVTMMKRHAVQTRLLERRLSFERRSFAYSNHIPERRSGLERREMPAAVAVEHARGRRGRPNGIERSSVVFKIVPGMGHEA